MSEQMRKEFEEWFDGEKPMLVGKHAEVFEQVFWHVWQASRHSLVVKLPKGDGDECGWVVSLADVEDVLDSAGVRYE